MRHSIAAAPKTCATGQAFSAALSFLERQAAETWPFDQIREALEDFSTEPVKAEARWQVLNASVKAIKHGIGC